MRMLSALDASFIYLEADHSPMHIGGVYLIDAKDCPDSFSYHTVFSHIESRLRCSRIFRQRLVEVPLGLSHPYWINDPDFDLAHHLPWLHLPSPGGKKELMQLSARIFERTLDRKRPLWDMSFVDGLNIVPGFEKGSFAIITRVHHAAVDGVSGVELMGALLDVSPRPRVIEGEDEWHPEQPSDVASMVVNAYSKIGQKSQALGKLLGEVAEGAVRLYGAGKVKKINPPPSPLSAPLSILNRPVSSSRTYWGVEFKLDRIRKICVAARGTTVNDVVLALCSAGLRNYMLERDVLPDKPLIAMVPISVRERGGKEDMGNQGSAMLVGLASDIADPVQRLFQISRNAQGSKTVASVLPANRLIEFVPSEALAAVTRLYTQTRLGGRHRPFFNLIITNVPGVKVPLYLAGAKLTQQMGMAPIIDGLGLTIVVLSYAGRISLGLTSCYSVVPDPDRLGAMLENALHELEETIAQLGAAGVQSVLEKMAWQDEDAASGKKPLERLHHATNELDRAIQSLKKKKGTDAP